MLTDIERKVLRILFNFQNRHRRMPTIQELVVLTGRKESTLFQTLIVLEEQTYITWSRGSINTIVIIESWERSYKGFNELKRKYL